MATKAWLDETADERFDAGCAGMGPVEIGCQSWMALSGVDPITGEEATPAQRALYGAQAVLNATGLIGLTAGGVEGGTKAITDTSVDGAGGIAGAPKTIPYQPKGSVVLQGDAPVCGPACAAMTITDKTGATVSLDEAIGSFANGVRSTGVNTMELSNFISKAGVKNTVNITMLHDQLNKALSEGASVIVQVPAGQGRHFIIVDRVKSIDGVNYYMTRDPYVGLRGAQKGLSDGAMSTGVNAIVIGR